MADISDIYEAHVQFELARWQPESVRDTVAEEIDAVFEWLAGVAVSDVVPQGVAREFIDSAISRFDVSESLVREVSTAVRAVHKAAQQDATLVGDLLDPGAYDEAVTAAIKLTDLRAAITEQVTTSDVYAQLMSHVLYQGIKNYLQTENVIAKKVPGASKLMKVSQSALTTAAPKLEKAIDKQLTAFVNANISDSIKDSQQFLNRVLDEKVLRAVADEFWDSNAKVAVSEYASLVPIGATDEFVEVARTLWNHIRSTDAFAAFIDDMVADFYRRHGKTKVTRLLADVSITPDVVIDLTEPLVSIAEQANKDGFIESRIRARLGAFYGQYQG